MKIHLKNLLLLCLTLSMGVLFSQNSLSTGFVSGKNPGNKMRNFAMNNDVFGTRNFIENKGQFINPVDKGEKVLFLYDHAGEKIYFTAKGLIYEQVKRSAISEEEEEERRERGEAPSPTESGKFYVNMNWVNANPGVSVEKAEKLEHYFTYGYADMNASVYKKITYKNVYKDIDVEYSIPTGKETGIKYSVILHSNADPDQFKILYTGDIRKVVKDRKGEVVVKTRLWDIIEHAPVAFYSDKTPLNTQVKLTRDTLSYIFPQGFTPGKTIVIDPWVTSVTSLTTTNSALDVDFDNSGNTFIYGGSGPFKIAKYNPAGVLLWTFGGVLVTPSWNAGTMASNFVVDKFTGKSYTGQGYIGSGSQAIRLDAAGNYDNLISVADPIYKEIWEMGFHCISNEVFIFGGTTSNNLSAATISAVNATLTTSTFQPGSPGCCQDIVSYAIDDLGQIFVLYASATNGAGVNNKICLVNSTFNGNVWTMPTGFTSMAENANKGAYQPVVTSNGFNALAVNNNYVFYYDGLNLAAYSKLTGVNVASITLTGMTLKRQGGIAVDDCNHIYIGGNGSILTYSFNGTGFTALAPIPLASSNPTANVHDIKIDRSTNTLFACGTGFVGTYTAGLSNNCWTTATLAVSATNATVCADQTVTLVASGASSYTWSNGSQSPSITVSSSVSTSYSVTGKNVNSCGNATGTTIGYLTIIPGPSVSITGPMTICKGEKRILTAGGANTYSWNTGAGTASVQITPTVNTSYTVVATNTVNTCTTKKVITVTVSACKGVGENTGEKTIAKIYPNPVKDKLNIELTDLSVKSVNLYIYNSVGQIVYSEENMNFTQESVNTIDVTDLAKGVYFIKLTGGSFKQSFRLVRD